MGNCFGSHAVQHVSGPSTNSGASRLSAHKSAETGKGKSSQAQENEGNQDGSLGTMSAGGNSQNYLHAFSYSDLRSATRNFRPDSLLGEGGFGSVFKGNIDERTFQPVRAGQGMLIAVKKLNLDGHQGHREWLAELKYLGTLKHPNLVKLVGYCYEDEHRLLVYEFLTRGSLENHLFGRNHRTISWFTRLKIAVDAARGLSFLHDAEKPVIYRDFKTANILLDSDFNAKLSDFGLAKDGPTGDKTHVTTRVLGTYGYAAPEYVATGRLTAKSDVYGFGVVLLEILTGKRAVDKDTSGAERNLVEWAMPYLTDKRKWSRVLDQKLDGQYSLKGAQKAADVALCCLSHDPKKRPTMKEILGSLEPLLNPKDPPKNSTSRSTSQLKSSVKESSRVHHPRPSHSKYGHEGKQGHDGKQGHTVDSHAKPANAFRLPSPQQIAAKQASHATSPFQLSPRGPSPTLHP